MLRFLILFCACSCSAVVSAAGCCSSIDPQRNLPTAYGLGLVRTEHRQQVREIQLLPVLPDATASVEDSLLPVINEEQTNGAYAQALVPELTNLGAAYLSRDQVTEALSSLSRAMHVTRINHGLNAPQQIPIMEQLISINLATGQWQTADQRLKRLYNLKQRQYEGYSTDMLPQLRRLADWHRTMYLAGVDKLGYERLLSLHELHTGMTDMIATQLGEDSAEHVPYLYGRLDAEYLLSVYEGEKESGFRIHDRNAEKGELPSWEKLRFDLIRDNNFRNGRDTILQIIAIHQRDPDTPPGELADAMVALGDWYNWFDKPAQALQNYREAFALMHGQADGQSWISENFTEPRELPVSTVFQPGVVTPRVSYNVDVHLRFKVSRLGRAMNIDVLSPSEEENQSATIRAYKLLRDTHFRPAMRDGEAVAMDGLERQYHLKY